MKRSVQTQGEAENVSYFAYRWSGVILAAGFGMFGVILILCAQLVQQSPIGTIAWIPRFLQDAGLAFLIAGTASTLVEQLIKKRTEAAFRKELCSLLDTTADSLSSELRDLFDAYIRRFEGRVEALKAALRGSNIEMVFAKRQDGFAEMATAIREAKEIIYVMGVSLREFSKLPTSVCSALRDVHDRIQKAEGAEPKTPEVKMLVLNNQSPEAVKRSSIEERKRFSGPEDPEYKVSHLFLDTRDTIKDIQKGCSEIKLRVYDNLSLFLLVTDRYVFMEPYHSGVKSVGIHPLIDGVFERVAELVPMIQFHKEADPGPYEQFRNHFIHVFDEATVPTEANTDLTGLYVPASREREEERGTGNIPEAQQTAGGDSSIRADAGFGTPQ